MLKGRAYSTPYLVLRGEKKDGIELKRRVWCDVAKVVATVQRVFTKSKPASCPETGLLQKTKKKVI